MSNSLRHRGLQHTRLPCPSPSPRACSNSRPLSQWCHPTILSSVIRFSCLQSYPTSGSFPNSQHLPPGKQNIGGSSSALVLPMDIQDWFPLGLTDLIALQFKELSRVFSSTALQKHQFFGAKTFLWCKSHICTWQLENPYLWLYTPWQSDASDF